MCSVEQESILQCTIIICYTFLLDLEHVFVSFSLKLCGMGVSRLYKKISFSFINITYLEVIPVFKYNIDKILNSFLFNSNSTHFVPNLLIPIPTLIPELSWNWTDQFQLFLNCPHPFGRLVNVCLHMVVICVWECQFLRNLPVVCHLSRPEQFKTLFNLNRY